jgi:hypothetical protein
VFGDSSLKIYANAGRYYLALPQAVAIRGAIPSSYIVSTYSYGSIDPTTGVPGNLTLLDRTVENGEAGQPIDPKTVAATNLQSMYQDEYKLGFEKTLGTKWKYGAEAIYRNLVQAIDDICDTYRLASKAGMSVGYASGFGYYLTDSSGHLWSTPACHLGNPSGNTYTLAGVNPDMTENGQYTTVTMTAKDWAWPSPMKRTYKAINLFLEHPFDGKWEFRFDYTWSKLQGNTEGPANSDTGQGQSSHDNGVSTSENWDVAEIMAYADGYLANDHRHQFKMRGSYAFNDEWTVSGNASLMSGAPANCFGYYNPDGSIPEYTRGAPGTADPVFYGSSYHSCFGQPYPPGTKFLPWTHDWDFGVTWKPKYFEHRMALNLTLLNAFNSQSPTSIIATSMVSNSGRAAAAYNVSNTYSMPYTYQTPRYVMFTLSYDY